MSQIPNDRIFNQLIIPGSHNSGTYDIQPQSKFSLSPDDPLPIWIEEISNILPISIVRPIVAGWSKTQPYSIKQQLNHGIRYLDFRVCLFQSHFYLCHALISVRLKKALEQIQYFIQQNPSEIILLDINHIYNVENSAQESQLVQLIQKYLGDSLIPNTYHVTDTIGTLRQSQKNIIVFMNSQNNVANNFWPESKIDSPWPNDATSATLKSSLDAEVLFRNQTYKSARNYFVLQIIKTEDTDEVIDGILNPAQYPNNISRYEITVNHDLQSWLTQYIARYGFLPINIVMQDWFTKNNSIVPLAILYDTQSVPTKKISSDTQEKLMELKSWFHLRSHSFKPFPNPSN